MATLPRPLKLVLSFLQVVTATLALGVACVLIGLASL
jgi:hypothetical protein